MLGLLARSGKESPHTCIPHAAKHSNLKSEPWFGFTCIPHAAKHPANAAHARHLITCIPHAAKHIWRHRHDLHQPRGADSTRLAMTLAPSAWWKTPQDTAGGFAPKAWRIPPPLGPSDQNYSAGRGTAGGQVTPAAETSSCWRTSAMPSTPSTVTVGNPVDSRRASACIPRLAMAAADWPIFSQRFPQVPPVFWRGNLYRPRGIRGSLGFPGFPHKNRSPKRIRRGAFAMD